MASLAGLKYYLKNPEKIYGFFASRRLLNWMSDKAYIKLAFRTNLGKKLNLEHPQTYNEKLQWLKLYDRKPEYNQMVDKYEAKRYVAERIGEEFIIPTFGVWDRFEDIDFDALPDQFVLKCTHDCGGLVICKDKKHFDKEAARRKINRCLKNNYFWTNREWPYKDVKPRVLAETYMEDTATEELRDYKFFCFDGQVKALFIATERGNETEETKFDFFDENYKHLPITNGHPNASTMPEKPVNFEKMKELAGKLSKGIPHLRVDFYEANGKIYFGELTFYHWSGIVPFEPEEWDYTFGQWIKLPK